VQFGSLKKTVAFKRDFSSKISLTTINHNKRNIMKSYRKELIFNIPSRRGFVNITHEVEQALAESGIREGLSFVNEMITPSNLAIYVDTKLLLYL
jgi:hypothetical protein